MNNIFSKTLAFGLFAAAMAAPLHAQDERQVVVSFADLDIDSDEGFGALEERIEKAVRKVCRAHMQGPVKTTSDPRDCRVAARQDASLQLARIMATVSVDDYASNTIVISKVSQARN